MLYLIFVTTHMKIDIAKPRKQRCHCCCQSQQNTEDIKPNHQYPPTQSNGIMKSLLRGFRLTDSSFIRRRRPVSALVSSSPCSSSSSSSSFSSSSSSSLYASSFNGSDNTASPPTSFALDPDFVKSYSSIKPPFGFNGLGELVYLRTYSRNKMDGTKERWHETVQRVVNGTFQLQQDWLLSTGMPWDDAQLRKMKEDSEEMYDRIFHMKMLPPGRGLWAMGTPLTQDRKLFAALNNCAFVSTSELASDPTGPFCFLMDASMLGVGVGFDTHGAGKLFIRSFKEPGSSTSATHSIPDSREGWVESLRLLLEALLSPSAGSEQAMLPLFDYSQIRGKGEPIKGFGGMSSGPQILQELHTSIVEVLKPYTGQLISITNIVDIMNLIGKCVVAGNIRRTAEIAFGDPYSEEYISLKDYSKNPHRAPYAWTSNNSIYAELGMDYDRVARSVAVNGEPGLAWLENMRAYGRMCEDANYKDKKAQGGNPCLEQTLESYEICCLVETFPHRHESIEDFKRTLGLAVTYAKTVTLGSTHWPNTNRVMLRNRRIGVSLSGIAQFISARGMDEMKRWCEEGYQQVQRADESLSGLFGVPRSIKTTCIKPSGTVSLLAGATAGLHHPESRYYIRRVRLSESSELLPRLREAGYPIDACVGDKNTVVVSIPVDAGEGLRSLSEVSMWEQLSLAAFFQRYWADNQVSCTVTFDPETEGSQIKHALDHFQYSLKGISFLPRLESGAYPQMPYEAIDEEGFREAVNAIRTDVSLSLNRMSAEGAQGVEEVPDKFCDTSSCSV